MEFKSKFKIKWVSPITDLWEYVPLTLRIYKFDNIYSYSIYIDISNKKKRIDGENTDFDKLHSELINKIVKVLNGILEHYICDVHEVESFINESLDCLTKEG